MHAFPMPSILAASLSDERDFAEDGVIKLLFGRRHDAGLGVDRVKKLRFANGNPRAISFDSVVVRALKKAGKRLMGRVDYNAHIKEARQIDKLNLPYAPTEWALRASAGPSARKTATGPATVFEQLKRSPSSDDTNDTATTAPILPPATDGQATAALEQLKRATPGDDAAAASVQVTLALDKTKLSSSDDPTASRQATAALQQLKLSIARYYCRARSAHSGEALRQADDERPACLSPADPDVIQDIEELRQDVRRDRLLFPDVPSGQQTAAGWAQTGREGGRGGIRRRSITS